MSLMKKMPDWLSICAAGLLEIRRGQVEERWEWNELKRFQSSESDSRVSTHYRKHLSIHQLSPSAVSRHFQTSLCLCCAKRNLAVYISWTCIRNYCDTWCVAFQIARWKVYFVLCHRLTEDEFTWLNLHKVLRRKPWWHKKNQFCRL